MNRVYLEEVYYRGEESKGWIISRLWSGVSVHEELFSCKCLARIFVGDFIDKRFKVKKPCKYCRLRKSY